MSLRASRSTACGLVLAAIATIAGCAHPSSGLKASTVDSCAETAAAQPLAEPLRPAFAPEAGRPLNERSINSRKETAPGSDLQTEEVVEAHLSSVFAAHPQGGWRLTQKVSSVQVRIDGAPVENRLTQLITRFGLEVSLSADGQFLSLLNPQAASEAVSQLFTTPEEATAAKAFFMPEAMEEGARREWESRYGRLFGGEFSQGKSFSAVERFTTSKGDEVAFFLVRTVQGWIETPRGKALQLGLSCTGRADSEEARAVLRAATPSVSALEPSVRCDGRQRMVLQPFLPVESTMVLTAELKEGKDVRKIQLNRESVLEPEPRASSPRGSVRGLAGMRGE